MNGTTQTSTNPTIRGTATVVFCFDVGFGVDLTRAADILAASAALPNPLREQLPQRRRAPKHFTFDPAPVRVLEPCPDVSLGAFRTGGSVETTLYDFGGASVAYTFPIHGTLADLQPLANALAENEQLIAESTQRLRRLTEQLAPAITRPHLGLLVEDYVTYQFDRFGDGQPLGELLAANRPLMAQILRGESVPLSSQEIDEALSTRISYSETDAAILDFAAAIVIDTDASDLLDIVEFANVELLEMRSLDEALDDALEEVYPSFPGRHGKAISRREMRRIAQHQIDAAVLFEGVNNAIKLVGDHYLARFYQKLAERLHHHDWDASVLRKLETLNDIYAKAADEQANRRMEILEWIIIVLFVVSIVLPFLTPLAK
ncbi:MAG: hypothetical protein K2Y21_08315 [Phycisphaerales bacterium]|nr:hypothetical protein [Phycisphaerales bacterium]